MSNFNEPGWLWLLFGVVGLIAVYVVAQLLRKQYAARFTNTELLSSIAPRRPGWRRHVAFGLLVLALTALTTAMAKPTREVEVPRDRATVVMAIDVSLSMRAEDVSPSRIEAAKEAAAEFVGLLPDRINLGLVTFSGTASVLVTPTTDRAAVTSTLSGLELSEATAIGEAIFSSIDAIEAFQVRLQGEAGGDQELPPARIVLLSDGTNTTGRSPELAVEQAKEAEIPVSTIAFGTDEGVVDIRGDLVPVPADKRAMEMIADETGGSYHTATSANELKEVYRDIGSQIGFTKEPREITSWFIGTGLLLGFGAAGLSLFWTNRLL